MGIVGVSAASVDNFVVDDLTDAVENVGLAIGGILDSAVYVLLFIG